MNYNILASKEQEPNRGDMSSNRIDTVGATEFFAVNFAAER